MWGAAGELPLLLWSSHACLVPVTVLTYRLGVSVASGIPAHDHAHDHDPACAGDAQLASHGQCSTAGGTDISYVTMQEVLGMALQKAQLSLPMPRYKPAPAQQQRAASGAAAAGSSAAEPWPDEEQLDMPEEDLLGSSSGAHIGKGQQQQQQEEDELLESPAQAGGAGSGSTGSVQQAGGPGSSSMVTSAVDPVAWRSELERLAPQLGRIKISRSADVAGGAARVAEWELRLQELQGARAQLAQQAQGLEPGLGRLAQLVGDELARLDALEARLNDQLEQHLQQHREGVGRLRQVQQECADGRERVSSSSSRLGQMEGRVEAAQQQAQDVVSGMDGALKLTAARDAIKLVCGEVRQMDLRMGLLQGQVMQRRKNNVK